MTTAIDKRSWTTLTHNTTHSARSPTVLSSTHSPVAVLHNTLCWFIHRCLEHSLACGGASQHTLLVHSPLSRALTRLWRCITTHSAGSPTVVSSTHSPVAVLHNTVCWFIHRCLEHSLACGGASQIFSTKQDCGQRPSRDGHYHSHGWARSTPRRGCSLRLHCSQHDMERQRSALV
jgi:hypothetical protein